MTQLIHYSDQPFLFDPTREYRQQRDQFKPVGFWLSVEASDADDADAFYNWRDWSTANDFRLEDLASRREFTLAPAANVLHIRTVDELDAFHRAFRVRLFGSVVNIDWQRVAARYDGLIIAPYQWRRRLEHEMTWYYGWDCSSGCIWNCRVLAPV